MTERLRRAIVPIDATIKDAMRSLEDSMTQIVLVVDDRGRLRGTLTDGDIRRALLRGESLNSSTAPHINSDFFSVAEDAGRAEVLELMQARYISQVPIVDGEGRLVGLHLLRELVSAMERPNWAVVMAGGRGVRLGELTASVPKPMLPVAGRPILERIVLQLVGSGIRRVFLSVNYLAEVIEAHFGDGHRFGCHIEYLREDRPLGTAGSLALLPNGRSAPRHPVLVMNGDLVTQANFGRLIDAHELGDQAATMAVRRHYQEVPFGCVDVEGDELVGFTEKPTTSRLINAGIYVIKPDCFASLPTTEPMSMPQLLDQLRASGQTVRVVEIDEEWIDVGRRDDFEKARLGQ